MLILLSMCVVLMAIDFGSATIVRLKASFMHLDVHAVLPLTIVALTSLSAAGVEVELRLDYLALLETGRHPRRSRRCILLITELTVIDCLDSFLSVLRCVFGRKRGGSLLHVTRVQQLIRVLSLDERLVLSARLLLLLQLQSQLFEFGGVDVRFFR